MRGTAAEQFESLRPAVLDRLLEIRPSIDDSFAPEQAARDHFDALLTHLCALLEGGQELSFREFVSRWIAMRAGEGLALGPLCRQVMAVGDAIIEVAKERCPPGADSDLLLRDLVRVNFSTVRVVADVLADELARRGAAGRGT